VPGRRLAWSVKRSPKVISARPLLSCQGENFVMLLAKPPSCATTVADRANMSTNGLEVIIVRRMAALDCSRWRGVVLHLWGTCAWSGRGWSLRIQSLFGRTANTRDRDSHGAWRTARDGVAIDHARGLNHAFDRSRPRFSSRGRDRKNTQRDFV
jgi:hypothetical protein